MFEVKIETDPIFEKTEHTIKNLKDENPWDIQSIYELQYFNCPKCIFKNISKQEFIHHAYEDHPEAIENLNNIEDGSLGMVPNKILIVTTFGHKLFKKKIIDKF